MFIITHFSFVWSSNSMKLRGGYASVISLKNIHGFEHVTIKLNIFVYHQKIIL